MALFCVQIDYFAANLALPRMASELHSTASDLQSVTLLIGFRALQGLGAALIFPVSVSALTNALPR